MGLQSLQYCAFLVAVAAVYLHLPVRMQPVFLLGASWVFYALAMPAMLPVTIAVAVFTYLCGRGLAACLAGRRTQNRLFAPWRDRYAGHSGLF